MTQNITLLSPGDKLVLSARIIKAKSWAAVTDERYARIKKLITAHKARRRLYTEAKALTTKTMKEQLERAANGGRGALSSGWLKGLGE